LPTCPPSAKQIFNAGNSRIVFSYDTLHYHRTKKAPGNLFLSAASFAPSLFGGLPPDPFPPFLLDPDAPPFVFYGGLIFVFARIKQKGT
jgi:hypothetical protein